MNEISDDAISHPDNDLLGMEVYAEQLADVIARQAPPFTVGIYGQWGSGKTSFVRLVRYCLCEQGPPRARLISFSAWQYKTADELWRALLLTIAEDMYGAKLTAPPVAAPEGVLHRLSTFLRSNAFGDDAAAEVLPDDRQKYEDIVARLGSGEISRTPSAPRLDPESLAIVIAKASVAVAGSMSPLLAGVRDFFGIEAKVKPEQLLRNGRDSATRERIESKQQFQKLFKQLLNDKANGLPVCVFVDDLDRCMPDVAFDLLEAIKVYFEDIPCSFIVAADEDHISHGLHLRYRTLGVGGTTAIASVMKGREYLEKIIQLGIRVPHRPYEQIHRLVKANFPEWIPATDIIHAAAGSNPRRVKQYCNRLTYKYSVARSPGFDGNNAASPPPGASAPAPGELPTYELFKKLVELRTWDDVCPELLQKLAEHPEYKEAVGALEEAVGRSSVNQPDSVQRSTLRHADAQRLYDRAMRKTPLYKLFNDREPPRLSAQRADHIAILLPLAAVKPDDERMLHVEDPSFERIALASSAARLGAAGALPLLHEDLTRWVLLVRQHGGLVERITALAAHSTDTQWHLEMAEVEARLRGGKQQGPELSDLAGALAPAIRDGGASVPSSLLQQPRFSTMLRQEILAFSQFKVPSERLVSSEYRDTEGARADDEEARAIAGAALKDVGAAATSTTVPIDAAALREALAPALAGLQLRIAIADQLLGLRTFAKLDALDQGWPDLAQLLRTDRPAFDALEVHAFEPQELPPWVDKLWSAHKDDDRLMELLRLRPRYRDLSKNDVDHYFRVSRQVAEPGEAAQSGVRRPGPVDDAIKYETVRLKLAAGPHGRYTVQLTAGGTTLPPEENTLDLVVAQRNASTLHLRPAATTRGASRDFSVPDSTDQNVPLLREIGAQTYEQLFPERLRAYVRGPLEEARSLRLVWDQDHGDRGLAILPWESLYASPMGPFLGLTRRCSLVRYFPGAIIPRLPLRPPLRMLVVMCSPAGAPRLDLGREKAMLEETVGADPRFDLDFLMEDQANLVELSARVAAFQPHVLHCVAHGVHADDDRVGALLLCEPDGKPRKVTSAQLATSLGGAAIRLAVLNSCDTGRSSRGDVVSGIAAALVSVGVPAVIATTRKVSDDPAIIFARAFYRAFLGGYMLEAALVEARAALHANDWDWAAYALFAGTLELDAIKVGPAPPFRGASIGSGNSPR